jgi:hypothetical protein
VSITGECQCTDDCDRPASCNGPGGVVLSDACWQRWRRAGKPAVVPPPRLPRVPEDGSWDEPDPGEIAARWGWVDPEVRRARAARAAVDLVRCVQGVPDRMGTELVMDRCTDWGALAVLLAWCADLEKVAALAGGAGEGKAA